MSTRNVHNLAVIVGKNVAQRRKELGLKQADLAEKLGIGADSLSRLEKGLIAPRFPRLEQIAGTLDCAVADLFRSANDSLETRAQSVADLLRVLPVEKQEEVVELVRRIVALGR